MLNESSKISKLGNKAASLCLPPKCMCCRRIISEREKVLCDECAAILPSSYGTEWIEHSKGGFFCVSPFYYEEPLRGAFLRYKFNDKDLFASKFSGYMADCVLKEYAGHPFDAVTWAPLNRRRLNQRGYDQAQLLARGVAEKLTIPLVRTIEKSVNTKAQSSISNKREREKNASNVYRLLPDADIRNKRFLLVDDILTTGSTLGECTSVLRAAGAAGVSCAVLARHRNYNFDEAPNECRPFQTEFAETVR